MATRQFAPELLQSSPASPARGDVPPPGDAIPENASPTGTARAGRRKAKRRRSSAAMDHVYGLPVPKGLHEAIETERGNLAKAESLLGCLSNSMEYESSLGTGPYYPDVADIARHLVRQSINALDSLALQERLLRNKIKDVCGAMFAEAHYYPGYSHPGYSYPGHSHPGHSHPGQYGWGGSLCEYRCAS